MSFLHLLVRVSSAVFLLGMTSEHGEGRYVFCGAFPLFLLVLVLVAAVVAGATGIKTPGENILDVRDNGECKFKGLGKVAGDVHHPHVVFGLRSSRLRLLLRLQERCGEDE